MRDDYQLEGPLETLEVKIEKKVRETIQEMAGHTQLSESEIVNTAMKRFIAAHKDFLPPKQAAKAAAQKGPKAS